MTFEQMWADLAPVGRSDATGGYLRQPFTAAEEEAQGWYAAECARRDLTVTTDAAIIRSGSMSSSCAIA